MTDLLSGTTAPETKSLQESAAVDLTVPGVRKHIAAQILADIDAYCVKAYDDGHRKHLGASLIGHDCARHLYYVFRWAKKEAFSGRMQRLFNRGHREEARFVEWLRGVGFEVWDVQPAILHYHPESNSYFYAETFNPGDGLVEDVTGDKNHVAAAMQLGIHPPNNQFRVKAVRGHYGGSLDGINKPPARYRIGEPMLCEFKTSGTGASFTKLKEQGVALAKPRHFAQMSTYGKFYGFRFALYMCINKNDDDLHIEIVELDWRLAEDLVRKAEDIITARVPPAKLAENEAFFECKYCAFVGICHRGEAPERSCRSCQHSEAIEGGEWYCHVHNGVIPSDFITKTCDGYTAIK